MKPDAGKAWKRYATARMRSQKRDGWDPDWKRYARRAFVAGYRAAVRDAKDGRVGA